MRKLDADTENEINKIRWERWRAKQKTEREKTCFYCWGQWNQWNQWNNWSDVPQDWSDDGSAEGNYTDIYSSVAVKIYSGTWQPGWQKWLYNGHICGGGAVRLKNTPPAGSHGWGCACHFFKVTEEYNKENFYFTTNEPDPERMGCVPHSGPDEDYSGVYSVLEVLANIMINLMGGYVSFAWAVASAFIDDLISAIDDEDLGTEQLICVFDYPRDSADWPNCTDCWPSDCGCWYKWNVWVNPSQTVKFDVYESFIGAENAVDGGVVEHSWTCTINSPPPPSEMSAAERRKYGIEEIPVSEIKERAKELGISPAGVKKLLELGEPVYIAKRGVKIEKHPTRVFRTDLASFRGEFARRTRSKE